MPMRAEKPSVFIAESMRKTGITIQLLQGSMPVLRQCMADQSARSKSIVSGYRTLHGSFRIAGRSPMDQGSVSRSRPLLSDNLPMPKPIGMRHKLPTEPAMICLLMSDGLEDVGTKNGGLNRKLSPLLRKPYV